jgi:predicted ATPase
MSDLIVKNYAIFKDSTSFKISPLTLLIGSNGSGKSSLIKVLQLIAYNLNYDEVDKFDLTNIKLQLQDSRKPLEISFKIAEDLIKKLRLKVYKDNFGNGEEEFINFNEDSLLFINEKGESILSTKEITINSSARGIRVELNVKGFYSVLEKNGYGYLKDKLIASSLPEKNISFDLKKPHYGEDFFEQWLFSTGMFETLNQSALDTFIPSFSEINEMFLIVFKPSFFLREINRTPPFNSRKSTLFNLEIIRLYDLGEAKRVFTPEDSFGKTLKELESLKMYGYVSEYGDSMKFFKKWIKEFFGSKANFEFGRKFNEFDYFAPKLNGKYLTEQGTGVFKILHLIAKLSSFFYEKERIKLLPKDIARSSNLPFIRRGYLVLEEPETNLHPDFQVKLAMMLFELAENSNYYVLVETHSEYITRTIQYLIAKNEENINQVGIINFGSEENAGKVKHISIKPNGGLSDNFFSGFFNYSEDLRLKLDAVNNKRNN